MVSSIRVIVLCGGLCLLAPALFGAAAVPLGVQACDTECQTKETDCDLACDQVAPCVDECRKVSEGCTVKCREAPPRKPDGSTKPAAAPEKKPAAPEKKPAGAPKAPAKVPPAKPKP